MTEIAEYCMTVHLFSATSSPGCATFGLRTLANEQHNKVSIKYSEQTMQFTTQDFYVHVDDGLLSLDSQEQAVEVVKQAINICA